MGDGSVGITALKRGLTMVLLFLLNEEECVCRVCAGLMTIIASLIGTVASSTFGAGCRDFVCAVVCGIRGLDEGVNDECSEFEWDGNEGKEGFCAPVDSS